MNILKLLVRLRDDLKSWVSLNLNALNAKIDNNTVTIDKELSSTSTNPVQNQAVAKSISSVSNSINNVSNFAVSVGDDVAGLKTLVGTVPVAEQIATAITEQDSFSGDYYDLVNAPPITEDGSDDVVVVDKNNNVMFKVDNYGTHTTTLFVNGENIKATLEQKVDAVEGKGLSTNDFTDADKAKLALIATDSETLSIDSQLSLTSENPVKNKVIAEKFDSIEGMIDDVEALVESKPHFSGNYTDLTNAPEIVENNTTEVAFADASGNIIAKVDKDGIHTTDLVLNGENLETKLSNEFKLIDNTLSQHDRLRVGIVPLGNAIAENKDLNTIEFLKVGNYYCSANVTVATLANCPTVHAFLMQVYSPLSKTIDNEETGQWVYRIRKMLTYEGQEFIQVVYSGATPGEFTYKSWEQSVTTKELQQATQSVMSKNPVSIELNQSGGLNNYGGFIDFHYRDADGNETGNTDYSSRIIETNEGVLKINNVTFDMTTRSVNAAAIHVDNAETWTFVMDDGTTVTKSVVMSL